MDWTRIRTRKTEGHSLHSLSTSTTATTTATTMASSSRTRRSTLLLIPSILLLALASSSSLISASPDVKMRALHSSSLSELEMITSWAPSDTNRFDPYTGSLLAPLLIPRVSGTANNTRVQEFILDYFAKLNATSLAGTVDDYDNEGEEEEGYDLPIEKRKDQQHRKTKSDPKATLHRRAAGTRGTGWHVEQDRFEATTPFGVKTFTNLIFTKNPHAENRLVFAAHFDSKYFPPATTNPSSLNGGEDTLPFVAATDSAAPCAILLDLAASLDRVLDRPDRLLLDEETRNQETTLQLIFFDGEEAFKDWTNTDSIYGSKHLAENWANRILPHSRTATGRNGGSHSNNLSGIELFVLLDLLGVEKPSVPSYFGATHWAHQHTMSVEQRLWDAKLHGGQVLARRKAVKAGGVEETPEQSEDEEDEMDQLEEEEAAAPLESFLTSNPPWSGIEDDHVPFLLRGVPILHIIPTPFPSVWHTLNDNADAISAEVVEGWANIFRTFTVEYLHLLEPRELRRRDEL